MTLNGGSVMSLMSVSMSRTPDWSVPNKPAGAQFNTLSTQRQGETQRGQVGAARVSL